MARDRRDRGARSENRAEAEPREARLLQAHLVVVVEVVDADHLVAVGAQPPRQVKADETGGAGDEVLHRSS
jgi:hypothetical protein